MKDRGFMVIMMWAQNNENVTPSVEDLEGMADEYGHTYPELADDNWTINNRYEKDSGIPTQILIAPGMEIVMGDGSFPSDSDIEEYLPD